MLIVFGFSIHAPHRDLNVKSGSDKPKRDPNRIKTNVYKISEVP